MSRGRIVLMVVAIVVALIGIAYVGLHSWGYLIYESRSCSWANIDNIELRTNIDIPNTIDCNCSYNTETDSKTAIFTLEMDSITIIKYADKNGFKRIDATHDFLVFKNLDNNIIVSTFLQKTEIRPNRESYQLLLDPSGKKLYVSLQYLN